ncbi:2,3-butanediol dehydrogenase [Brevibacterium sp. S111]|jgi:(R,R)-butanediol dehydrogenase/meso-butanediol dehydrogenase/diacetyl reductase|uniref:2,3-butanediol dehydrogenase n=1 Tax=unclassified Brevibacterium TaxID=2614124 RepID=UPI001080A6A4|nr:2,3-butanediol dehydrogenase [Brevibacterium sp. S111]TGD10363.1 2,3-butanediol dehydrogenase [Brevibacterium sp. S111]
MKAVRYYGKEDIRIDEVEEPKTRPGTVKIAPAFNGICGSDLHLYQDGPIRPAPSGEEAHPLSGETLPVVFGHEFSGVIEDIGDGVEGLEIGDSVVVEPLMVDGTCPACRRGAYNLCEQMGFIGISGRGGGLSEHIVVESQWVHPVGDMPLDQAALIEPLAVSLHGVKQTAAAEGQIAVVGGAGPIGLLVSAVLKAKGLTTIVSEVSQARRAKALESGAADVVIDPTTENLGEVVSEQTSGAMADLAFDAAGAPAVVGQLLDVLGATGRLQVLAIHGAPVEVDITDQLMMQDRTLGASVGYAHDHAEAIDLVRSGKIDLAPFVTSKILAEDIISDGFDRLTNSQDEVKILVSMS